MFRGNAFRVQVRIIGLIILLLPFTVSAKSKFQTKLLRPVHVNGQVTSSKLNVGNWGFWVNYEGQAGHDPVSGGVGGFFPKGKTPLIYMDGILWGAFLIDPQTSMAVGNMPRVGGIHYHIGVQPGWINADGTPANWTDERVRVYRIRSDWRTLSEADLREECASLLEIAPEQVTQQMMRSVLEQYKQDWKEWPVDLGAPYVDVNHNGLYDPVRDQDGCPDAAKGDYPGICDADQVIWLVVNDLDKNKTLNLSGSLPIGLEVRMTFWTYKGWQNPMGDVVFKRVELINRSGFILDSMYVSMFTDPDIGDYANDLVGCDSVKSIAFAYNGTDNDEAFQKFDLKPGALVYDLLQGPMIRTDNAQDTAFFDFKKRIGFKNLKMTSFATKVMLNENPPLGSIDITFSVYNMMRGFNPLSDIHYPERQVFLSGPRAGQPTNFPLSGNPVTDPYAQLGDIDGQGGNWAPGDRRMYLNSGPFTMQLGERQDMILAIIGGLGKDRLNSLVRAWETDALVKRVYKNGLNSMPKPPAPPLVKATPFDNMIVLNWGIDPNRVRETEEVKHDGYIFEGYNIYQLPNPTASLTDVGVQRIATFDRVDGIRYIIGPKYSSEYHDIINVPLQYGTDSGIKRHFLIKKDYLTGRPLYPGATYYFAVTAYNYNKDVVRDPSMESLPQPVAVTVQGPKPGERYEAKPDEALDVHQDGNTDTGCEVIVADPSQTTGHQYEVFFTQDTDTLSPTYGELVWNLRDVNKNNIVLKSQKVFIPRNPSEIDRFPFSYADGLNIKVYWKHKPGIKAIVEVANGNGPLPESQWDSVGKPFHGNNVWHSLSAPSDPNHFYISAGGGSGTLERIERSIQNAHGHDFEMRFTQRGGIYAWWYDADTAVTVPFEIWDVGLGTFEDRSDDVRCLTGGYSGGETVGKFDFAYTDHAFGFPATDWIYARVPLNKRGSWDAYYQDVTSGAYTYDWWRNSQEVLARIIICDFDGAKTLPETGTVIRFITYKGPLEDTRFLFTAPGRIENSRALAQKDVEKINVFPNPFYGGIQWSPNGPVQGVKFNHLPRHAIIRIFTLDGTLVRKIEKNDNSQFYYWNLGNEAGQQIASGLYIIHIEMPELKKTKNLKLMVVMGE